jgi:TIR domain
MRQKHSKTRKTAKTSRSLQEPGRGAGAKSPVSHVVRSGKTAARRTRATRKKSTAPSMTEADVFISYNQGRETEPEAIARKLRREGYSVWWAKDLPATGSFRSEIDRRLDRAKAVIVVWSKRATRSDWVCAEAEHARQQHKLINTHTAEIKAPASALPKPFGQTQSVPVRNMTRIIKALDCLSVPRKRQRATEIVRSAPRSHG